MISSMFDLDGSKRLQNLIHKQEQDDKKREEIKEAEQREVERKIANEKLILELERHAEKAKNAAAIFCKHEISTKQYEEAGLQGIDEMQAIGTTLLRTEGRVKYSRAFDRMNETHDGPVCLLHGSVIWDKYPEATRDYSFSTYEMIKCVEKKRFVPTPYL